MPIDGSAIRREHVEAWIGELLERWRPATASNRYRGLQAFMRWAVEEGEIRESPMAKMRPPRGARASEVVGLRYTPTDPETNDVDLDQGVLRVTGEGSRVGGLAIGRATVRASDRYVRVRARRRDADLPWLWLGRRGRLRWPTS
jgi:site-specific recombinase XerC